MAFETIIRVRFKDRYKTGLVSEAARMQSNKGSDPVTYTTNVVIRNLARRIKRLNAEMRNIDEMLTDLIEEIAPGLFDLHGVGVDTTSRLTWSETTVLIMTCRPHPPSSWRTL